MRRIIRGFLWLIKGTLLAIALGALVLWPMSHGRWLAVYGTRKSIEPQRVEFFSLTAECSNGWIVIGRDRQRTVPGPWLIDARRRAIEQGLGWQWKSQSEPDTWMVRNFPSSCGPIRWSLFEEGDSTQTTEQRYFSAPCWALILTVGVWPFTSIGLLIRRRIWHRRLLRGGHCRVCGYDLRASPDRCSECGALPEVKA